MRKLLTAVPGLFLCVALCVCRAPVAHAKDMKCTMTFTMSGWSLFYKAANGTGVIHCANGQSMKVKLRARGGGVTIGKSTIDQGYGVFTGVVSIEELLGTYATARAHAGVGHTSGKAQVMTRGEVSLALSGKGHGWNIGIDFGKLTISRR